MMLTAQKPKTSKIGAAFSRNLSATTSQLPSRIGGNQAGNMIEQRSALPTGNSYTSAPVQGTQADVINKPQEGPDIYGATGTAGIARMGDAANQEVANQVSVKRQQEANARSQDIMGQFNQAGQAIQNGMSENVWGGGASTTEQGASLAPKMGANGSASWINSNNGRYHDFDGAFGAQCVDLYNFYMTGFVGGRSSVGQVNYAQELWQVHDRGALVQIARNQRPQMGDIAIWSNAMNGQGGHVAIVTQDNGNGTIRVLNANATSAGSRGNTVMSNLSTGTLLGYLRPRKLMR